MRIGEGVALQSKGGEKRESKAPKKGAEGDKGGGTIGELIKQKLGEKLGMDKKDEE